MVVPIYSLLKTCACVDLQHFFTCAYIQKYCPFDTNVSSAHDRADTLLADAKAESTPDSLEMEKL